MNLPDDHNKRGTRTRQMGAPSEPVPVEPRGEKTTPNTVSTSNRSLTGSVDSSGDHQNNAATVFLTGQSDSNQQVNAFARVPSGIGRFVLQEELGQGGFGKVFRAIDQILHRDVAIKVLPRHTPVDQSAMVPFQEGQAAARLSHPYLVPLYEVLDDDHYIYLVSEFCAGPNLLEWLQEQGHQVPLADAIELAIKICQGVAYAHQQGLAHRDIKPSNILLVGDGVKHENQSLRNLTPRLTDFGLALDLINAGEIDGSDLFGTPHYMSPERFSRDRASDPLKADQYALGVVLYQLVSGELPFADSDVKTLVKAMQSEQPRPLKSQRPDADDDLCAVVEKCLNREPQERYDNVQALIDDLTCRQNGLPVAARQQSRAEKVSRFAKRHPIETLLLAVLLAISTVAAVVLVQNNRRLRTTSQSLQSALERADRNAAIANLLAKKREAALREAKQHEAIAETNGRLAVQAAYRADLRQAFAACASGDPSTALFITDQIRKYADHSITERADWRLLQTIARFGWRRLQVASPKSDDDPNLDTAVENVILIPSRGWIVISQRHGVVRIFDQSQQTLLYEISLQHKLPRGLVGRVRSYAAAVSKDGQWLAIGEQEDANLLNWNGGTRVALVSLDKLAETAKPTIDLDSIVDQRLTGFAATVESLAFSPNGNKLAVGVRYEPVQVIDLNNTDERVYVPSTKRNDLLVFHNDDELLLTPNKKQTVKYHLASEQPEVVANVRPQSHIELSVMSQSGRWVVTCRNFSSVFEVIDRHSPNNVPRYFAFPSGDISTLAISPDEVHLLIGSSTGHVGVWNFADFENYQEASVLHLGKRLPEEAMIVSLLANRVLHDAPVTTIAVSEKNQVITGAADGSVASWSLQSDAMSIPVAQQLRGSSQIAIHPDGKTIYIGNDEGNLIAMDIFSGKTTKLFGHTTNESESESNTSSDDVGIFEIAVSPDGRLVAFGRRDGSVYVLNTQDPTQLAKAPQSPSSTGLRPGEIIFDAAADRIVINRNHYFLDVCTIESDCKEHTQSDHPCGFQLQLTASLRTAKSVEALAFSDHENLLLIGDRIRTYRIGDALEQELGDGIQGISTSYRGLDRVIVGSVDGRLRSIDLNGNLLATSRRWRPFESPTARDHKFCSMTIFSKDQLILTGSFTGEVGLWNYDDLEYLGSFHLSADNLHPIADLQLTGPAEHLCFYQRIGDWQDHDAESKLFVVKIDRTSTAR